ncbi:hypothetical protein LCGC14_3007480, partial [marine sediment metagenome]
MTDLLKRAEALVAAASPGPLTYTVTGGPDAMAGEDIRDVRGEPIAHLYGGSRPGDAR